MTAPPTLASISNQIDKIDELATDLIDGLKDKLIDVRADRERMHGALEHIANVCKGSRQSTRRIRWIEARARSAMLGDQNWETVDLPKHEPGMERLQNMVVSIYELLKREFNARVEDADDDRAAQLELELIDRFLKDARHNVQLIREMENRRADQQVRY